MEKSRTAHEIAKETKTDLETRETNLTSAETNVEEALEKITEAEGNEKADGGSAADFKKVREEVEKQQRLVKRTKNILNRGKEQGAYGEIPPQKWNEHGYLRKTLDHMEDNLEEALKELEGNRERSAKGKSGNGKNMLS